MPALGLSLGLRLDPPPCGTCGGVHGLEDHCCELTGDVFAPCARCEQIQAERVASCTCVRSGYVSTCGFPEHVAAACEQAQQRRAVARKLARRSR